MFHWTERTVKPGETLVLRKSHTVAKVSSRALYAREQALDLRVNGEPTEAHSFALAVR